jgi:hypothetical protein
MWTRSKQTALLTSGLERRKPVALPQLSRGREHLVDYERSDLIYLVIRDQVRSPHSKAHHAPAFVRSSPVESTKETALRRFCCEPEEVWVTL